MSTEELIDIAKRRMKNIQVPKTTSSGEENKQELNKLTSSQLS